MPQDQIIPSALEGIGQIEKLRTNKSVELKAQQKQARVVNKTTLDRIKPSASKRRELNIATRALHGYCDQSNRTGPLVSPIVQSTGFFRDDIDQLGGHAYSRVSNPSVEELETLLGALESAPPAVCFSSGLAAETALFLSLLKQGDHAVIAESIYGGTDRLFRAVLAGLGITFTFVDATNTDSIKSACTDRSKVIFIETPSNPLLKITDVAAVAKIAKEKNITLVVDNTFLTSIILRPLELGADVSLYSTTKHIEGHSLAVGGAVISRDEKYLEELRFIRKSIGGIQTPLNAWLTSRGVATLPLRVQQHSNNALVIAQWLEKNPFITKVNYPGLRSHPQKKLADKQHGYFHGGVISFEVKGGVTGAKKILGSTYLCALADHVGGVQTILTHSASMTHVDVPVEHRRAIGISDGLMRLSVGLESPYDVIEDLDQAFVQAHR